jgi:5'(3')-deoxyribonucleotidase
MNGIRKGLKTIVWDVDDVLNELMKSWFELFWLPNNPTCKITYDKLSKNPPHQILGVNKQEYLDSLDQFRKSEYALRMRPTPVLVEWFESNGGKFHHIALTSTPLQSAAKSAEWVIRNFGAWIRSFNFVPSMRMHQFIPKYNETKEDFLKWWKKADIFVDDNPVNLSAIEALGIKTICIPQPWNRNKRTLAETLEELTNL